MPKDQDLQSAHSLLLRLKGGSINEMMTDAVNKAVREISDACLDRGGRHKASVTLRLDFVMDQKDKVVEVYADINEKHPKAPIGRCGMYYADSEGHLCRENPRQLTLDDELESQRRKREAAAGQPA